MGLLYKYKAHGSIERYEACLVVLWNTQNEGVDYGSYFSICCYCMQLGGPSNGHSQCIFAWLLTGRSTDAAVG